ncbi:DUF1697 domain-containing protein [soil metagenome]
MERLRREFETLGFSRVETFIASGNVIFESRTTKEERLREKVERHLGQALGYDVATFLRSPAELKQMANYRPFSSSLEEGHSIFVGLLPAPPSAEATKNLIACRSETDEFHVHERQVYWLCRTRLSDSKFSGARLERILEMPATLRNLTTIRRLLAKYP